MFESTRLFVWVEARLEGDSGDGFGRMDVWWSNVDRARNEAQVRDRLVGGVNKDGSSFLGPAEGRSGD